jgi:hypothetical protein
MLEEEVRNGHFRDAEELLTQALHAWREKHNSARNVVRPNLAEFPLNSPFAGSDLHLERKLDYGRPVNL